MNDHKKPAIGKRLRALRENAGLSRRVLAIKIDVDQQSIYRWETDKQAPSLAMVYELADALGCTPGELLSG